MQIKTTNEISPHICPNDYHPKKQEIKEGQRSRDTKKIIERNVKKINCDIWPYSGSDSNKLK